MGELAALGKTWRQMQHCRSLVGKNKKGAERIIGKANNSLRPLFLN